MGHRKLNSTGRGPTLIHDTISLLLLSSILRYAERSLGVDVIFAEEVLLAGDELLLDPVKLSMPFGMTRTFADASGTVSLIRTVMSVDGGHA